MGGARPTWMDMGGSDPDPKAGRPLETPAGAERQARLAKALRDNLRRRKAGRASGDSPGDDGPEPR